MVVFVIIAAIALAHVLRLGARLHGEWYRLYYGYFSDLVLPFGIYFLLSLQDDRVPILSDWRVKAALVLGMASFAEVLQAFGVPLLGNTFDPYDFVAYGAGVALAVGADRGLLPRMLPAWSPSKAPHARVRVAAAVVWRDGRLLMTQRPPGGPLGLQWEFPGGKLESGETPERALAREIQEELGVGAHPLEVLAVHSHRYDHGLEVEITFIRCELESFELAAGHGVHAIHWWDLDELDVSGVLEGDRDFLTALEAGRRHGRS